MSDLRPAAGITEGGSGRLTSRVARAALRIRRIRRADIDAASPEDGACMNRPPAGAAAVVEADAAVAPPARGAASGIVLAGGSSRRFGRNKLAEPLAGRPLLHRPVLALAAVCAEVIVAGPPDLGLLPQLPVLPVPLRLVSDPEPYGGPLVGVSAGLAAARFPVAVVVGGDMPDLAPALLIELLRLLSADVDAVALRQGSSIRPLPCVLRTSSLAAVRLRLGAGRRSLRELLESIALRAIDEPAWRAVDPEASSLRDVDRPEDLG